MSIEGCNELTIVPAYITGDSIQRLSDRNLGVARKKKARLGSSNLYRLIAGSKRFE
jgi:hypothetical protein